MYITQMLLGSDGEFLILACDGLWNVLTSQAAVEFVKLRLGTWQQQQPLDQLAQQLVEHALQVHTASLIVLLQILHYVHTVYTMCILYTTKLLYSCNVLRSARVAVQ
jgi:Protein phosphatase 2C